jgi:hypothetical protein
MEKRLAEEYAKKYHEFSNWFNAMTELTLQTQDSEMAARIRKGLAEMAFMLDDTVRLPLKDQFPDLF